MCTNTGRGAKGLLQRVPGYAVRSRSIPVQTPDFGARNSSSANICSSIVAAGGTPLIVSLGLCGLMCTGILPTGYSK